MPKKKNPRKAKIPFMRRQDALKLAEQVATTGWRHRKETPQSAEYWEKTVPGGEIHIIESASIFGGYDLQYVTDGGVVVKLGRRSGTLRDAQVRAVLEAAKRGYRVVNPKRTQNLAPSQDKWIAGAIKHPGRLSKLAKKLGFPDKPFMKRSLKEQKAVMDLCVDEYGYRSCLGSAMLLHNLPSIRRDPRMRARAKALKDYLVSAYGGPGSFGRRRKNPPSGEWEAIPIMIFPHDIKRVTLTTAQVDQLSVETI